MKIGTRTISPEHPPYIIAELSGNHLGDIHNLYRLIDEAKFAGADAVKVQCYSPDDMTIKCSNPEFVIHDGPWKGRLLYDLYQEACTPPEWMADIFDYARNVRGMEIFASVFDEGGVSLMESLQASAFKVASFEITDVPLLGRVGQTKKPVIISTGMASTKEIMDAVYTVTGFGTKNHDVALLHCISAYPALASQSNLPALGPLSELLGGRQVGISDHTLGVGVAAAAVAFGACIVEKHLCLSRSAGGPDAGFSLEPSEFGELVRACREAWEATRPSRSPAQKENLQFRRSIYVTADVCAGDTLSKENIRVIRPAHGLPPKFYETALGRVAKVDLQAGTPLSFDHFDASGGS